MDTRVLITWGGWPGHHPEAMTQKVVERLSQEGCATEVIAELEPLADPDYLAGFSAVCVNWTMSEAPKEAIKSLRKVVEDGTGLAGWHGGLGDAFRANTDFQFMVGGQFVAHPGNIKKYRVEISDVDHPITRGMSDFDMESEQYYMHVDPANQTLATTVCDGVEAPWTQDVRMPVAWTREHGNGRVAYSALGHQPSDFEVPEALELAVRSILWAARCL